MSDAAPAVRSYYSSVSNVNWTNNDEIYVFSTFTDAMDDADHQHAHYNVGETGGYTYGYFNHVVNGSLTDPIYWYDNTQVGEQHFYAYYPAESVGADPEAGRGSIEFDTYEGGSSYFHVPADQSAMAHIIPATSNDEPHPLAYAMAATKKVGVGYEGDESPVEFLFHDIMNVLRIHVNNPTDQPVKGVKVNCSSTYYVAGTATVSTIHERYLGGEGAPLQYGQFYIGFAYNGASSDEVFAIENTPLQTSDLYYDLYLLPNYYSANSLEVTVLMGDDTDASNDITKAIPSVFSQSTMKKVRIDIPEDPVYNYAIYMVDVPGG